MQTEAGKKGIPLFNLMERSFLSERVQIQMAVGLKKRLYSYMWSLGTVRVLGNSTSEWTSLQDLKRMVFLPYLLSSANGIPLESSR